jgi:hypothetical protein
MSTHNRPMNKLKLNKFVSLSTENALAHVDQVLTYSQGEWRATVYLLQPTSGNLTPYYLQVEHRQHSNEVMLYRKVENTSIAFNQDSPQPYVYLHGIRYVLSDQGKVTCVLDDAVDPYTVDIADWHTSFQYYDFTSEYGDILTVEIHPNVRPEFYLGERIPFESIETFESLEEAETTVQTNATDNMVDPSSSRSRTGSKLWLELLFVFSAGLIVLLIAMVLVVD